MFCAKWFLSRFLSLSLSSRFLSGGLGRMISLCHWCVVLCVVCVLMEGGTIMWGVEANPTTDFLAKCHRHLKYCEKSPLVTQCIVDEGCHMAGSDGAFVIDTACNLARDRCASAFDDCLFVMCPPVKNVHVNCTYAAATKH